MGRGNSVKSNARSAVKMADLSEMSSRGQSVVTDSPGYRVRQKQNCFIKRKIDC